MICKLPIDFFPTFFSVTHNFTFNDQNGTKDEPIKDFAYICIDQSVDLQSLIDHYFYPISLSVSMMCFILTFLLYSFLPQLRDLTGKFILGICLCLCVTFASLLVKQFGLKDSNVEQMWVEVVLHASIVGVWFCLSSMVCFLSLYIGVLKSEKKCNLFWKSNCLSQKLKSIYCTIFPFLAHCIFCYYV